LQVDGFLEFSKDVSSRDVEDGGIEDGAVLEDFLDVHLILEGIDLELIEEGGLGSTNLITNPDNLLFGNDFNLGLNNLGLDLESLEERCLLGIKTGGTSRDGNLSGGDHTSLGGGRSRLSVEDFLNLGEVTIGEDNVRVQNELGHNLLNVVVSLIPLILTVFVVLITLLGLNEGCLKSGLHEGVLTHDHLSVDGSELLSQEGNLFG